MSTKPTAPADVAKAEPEHSDTPLLDTLGANVKGLITRGKERGYVTYYELDCALPPEQVPKELIENTMALLSELGISVMDAKQADEAVHEYAYFLTRPIFERAEAGELRSLAAALLEDPKSINSQDPETHMTALHWAGVNRHVELARVLFAHKAPPADPWIRDRWGRLAVDLAIETGNQSLIELFHRHMFPEDYAYDFDPLDPPEGAAPVITPKRGL